MTTAMARPWQGTFLGVINIIGVVFSFLAAILFLFMQGYLSSMMGQMTTSMTNVEGGAVSPETAQATAGLMSMLGGMGAVAGIIFIAVGVLLVFMARGAFRGQKWTLIVSLVFGILGLLGFISTLMQRGDAGSQIVSLVINLLMVYCAYICLKSPYYNHSPAN